MTPTVRTPPVTTNMLHRLVGVTLACAALMAVLIEDTGPTATKVAGRAFAEQIEEARARTQASMAAGQAAVFSYEDEPAPESNLAEPDADANADTAADGSAQKQTKLAETTDTIPGPPLPTERNLPGRPMPVD